MRWSIRPGILCQKILGETVLFSVGDAVQYCPGIELLNEGAAYYWALLEQASDEETILNHASKDLGIPAQELRPGLSAFMKMLAEKGYIVLSDE